MPPAIEIENLTKKYGPKTAVDGLSLIVEEGTCLGFLGPNGAGKSTTVKMLSGLARPTSGRIRLAGEEAGKDRQAMAKIGVMPEDCLLFDYLSFDDHFRLLGPLYGLPPGETEARAGELLDLLGLASDRKTIAAEASYGMKKKLCLALALLHNPAILILDEPFEGLDPLAAVKVEELLLLLRRRGKTIFLCSHILSVVEEVADEAAILARGRLVFRDRLDNLRRTGRSLKQVFIEKAFPPQPEFGGLRWLA